MSVQSATNAPLKPSLKRPWVWVAITIAAVFILSNVNAFPGGRYTCTWSGGAPSGELAGDLVVTVGTWPSTYPLKARIFTQNGPVTVKNWSHAHSSWSREINAEIPIGSDRFQALCELG